ncbi:SH3 domain-containing protein [Oceanobacillus sojae]|uniref:SH3 domain-containing protein n=1 Tax=Oceanobacillus sojae TaxID=582851 RepID=UPI003639BBAE
MNKKKSILQFSLLTAVLFILVQFIFPLQTYAESSVNSGENAYNEKLHSGDNGISKEELNSKGEAGIEEESSEEELNSKGEAGIEEESSEEELNSKGEAGIEEESSEEELNSEGEAGIEEESSEEELNSEGEAGIEEELSEEELNSEEEAGIEEELSEEELNSEEEAGIEEELSEEELNSEEEAGIEEESSEDKTNLEGASKKELKQTDLQKATAFADSSTGYFKVNVDNLTVYDNRGDGPLKPMGKLKKGEVYSIHSDYGSWWRVQFGDVYGYVKKSDTQSGRKSDVKNWNKSYNNTDHKYKAKQNVTVYDNTSGKLIPFGELNKETVFPIASDYGSWWRVIYLDRVGYVKKDEGNVQYANFQDHFKADKTLPIYDNRSGSLKQVGEIEKGQVYKRVNDYGSWHRIQFGDIYGYVEKFGTSLDNGKSITNENKDYTDTKHKYKANQTVTVYDNSSGNLKPFGKLAKGTVFPIASDYTNWWRIIFADRVGYVHKSQGEIQHANFNDYFKVDETTAIYDNRGSGPLKQVGEVIKGQEYSIVSDYGNWHRIQFGDIYGYVKKINTSPSNGKSISNKNKNYTNTSRDMKALQKVTVYDNSSGSLKPFGYIEKDSVFPIATDYGSWWRIIFADRIGYVSKNEVQAEFKKGDKFFKVHKNNLPIYDNRGSGSLKKVGSLQKNQVFSIVSDYGSWWRVQFGDIYGYVKKSETGYATGTEVKNLNKSYKNSERKLTPKKQVDVYDNTSGSLVSMGKIDSGIEYSIVSDYGNWWRVVYLDRVGYVLKSDVNVNGGSAVKTPYNMTLAEALKMQMNAGAQTDSPYAYVSKAYISNNKVTASALNVRGGPSANYKSVGQLSNGATVTILGEYNGWYQISYNHRQWVNASEEDVLYYLDPTNFTNDDRQQFQFLDLSKTSGASLIGLNNYLTGKGTLSSQGQAFKDASKKHGINDVYLLSHAILETGNGSSTLAQGVMYNGVKVYNMYGVGAFDNCAIECGAKKAYEEGWTTPYKAIIGGASFIGNDYVKAGQNTLYKMRWNPEGMDRYGYATHQYATDIGWAQKQVSTMYNLYQALNLRDLELDIPDYKL